MPHPTGSHTNKGGRRQPDTSAARLYAAGRDVFGILPAILFIPASHRSSACPPPSVSSQPPHCAMHQDAPATTTDHHAAGSMEQLTLLSTDTGTYHHRLQSADSAAPSAGAAMPTTSDASNVHANLHTYVPQVPMLPHGTTPSSSGTDRTNSRRMDLSRKVRAVLACGCMSPLHV